MAIEISSVRPNGQYVYKCKCDCGNYHTVQLGHLVSGNVKSCGCISKLPEGEASFNSLYYKYGYDASKRNYDFKLTKDEFKNLINGHCFYCGSPPIQSTKWAYKNGNLLYNGIDRIDNLKGYSVDNCVSCCGVCNRMKMAMHYNEFIEHIKSIVRYRIERKDDTAN